MFVMMRHGERGDLAFPVTNTSVQYDPPLASTGKSQVQKAAYHLSKLIMSHNIQRIQIHSSPFLRCIMTAQLLHKYIVQNLSKLQVQDKIKINNLFCQFLRTQWFQTSPFPNLILNSVESEKYIDKSQLILDSFKDLQFPENYILFSGRVQLAKQKFLQNQQQNVCKIIVTHGFVVKELCVNSLMYLRFGNQINYCQYQAEYKGQTIKYVNRPMDESKL